MNIIWEIEFDLSSPGVRVSVISTIGGPLAGSEIGTTEDPTIIALACAAFTYRFWVHMTTETGGRINALDVLPDCSLAAWTPSPSSANAIEVRTLHVAQPDSNGWPELEAEFADGKKVIDPSRAGIIEPILRAALVSGEGVFDRVLSGTDVEHLRISHESPAVARPEDPRAKLILAAADL